MDNVSMGQSRTNANFVCSATSLNLHIDDTEHDIMSHSIDSG